MKKVVLSVVAALAMIATAPAFAADMPVKSKPAAAPAAAPSPWDVLFGVAFTSDYVLRGISQTNRKPAPQGYFEVDYTAADWVKLYAGAWGSSLAEYNAEAEIDLSGGVRFSYGNFGLDLGFVYYYYPDGGNAVAGNLFDSFGEFYAKPSYKVADWLTIGAIIDGGDNFNNGYGLAPGSSKGAWYYSGNATITFPWHPIPDVTISLNPEVGRQEFDCTPCTSYTYWDVGLDFNWKAITLDLRYWDTDQHGTFLAPAAYGLKDLGGSTFVATLKFDTSISALK